ncbi:GNAT family N-acetyltransferase [Litorimonas haliclonae]|uniref:GNAT family N-acetyltransferase n=1 Tax=Litorimonas haliclonae TaxID=2081977 RepID=UPI0039EF5C54
MTKTGFKTAIYKADVLPASVTSAWPKLRSSNPRLYSPYFHPDYTKTIASLVDNVRIAVAEDEKEILAILPFQGERFARPIGAPMTDYHGLICRPDCGLTIGDILKDSSVGAFHYSALVENGMHNSENTSRGAMIYFPDGAEAWKKAQSSSYTRHMKDLRRRTRKSDEQIGSSRFEFRSQNPDLLKTLFKWKIAQYERSGFYNIFGVEWTSQLLRDLWERPICAPLRVDMHALYIGDRLAAIDTGLTDGTTYHSWIVAYDPTLGIYSPGARLLNAILDKSDDLGYERLDLGVGIDAFKRHYATEDVTTSSGFTPISGPAAALAQVYDAAEKLGQKKLGDAPGRLRRRYSQIAACENTVTGRAKAMVRSVANCRL